jgi:hypothetical protein
VFATNPETSDDRRTFDPRVPASRARVERLESLQSSDARLRLAAYRGERYLIISLESGPARLSSHSMGMKKFRECVRYFSIARSERRATPTLFRSRHTSPSRRGASETKASAFDENIIDDANRKCHDVRVTRCDFSQGDAIPSAIDRCDRCAVISSGARKSLLNTQTASQRNIESVC